jgi:type IV secretion system protein VirB9
MKRSLSLTGLLVVTFGLFTPSLSASQTTPPSHRSAPRAAVRSRGPAATPELNLQAKVIAYTPHAIALIRTRIRFSTLITLPKEEVILDYVCGDKDRWIIEGNQNLAYIKPADEGAQTNLNLVTASGNVYSFVLTEVSGNADGSPDLNVFVELTDTAMAEAAAGPRRFVAASELEESRQQTQTAKDTIRQVEEHSQDAANQEIKRFLNNRRFAYRYEANKPPFYVRVIYRDDVRTYIEARPEETPTIVELRDGRPNIVNFTYENGIYVTDRILESGYLVVGKKRLKFYREE